MATSARGSGMVGYNVQAAVDTTHHLIVVHDVVNEGHDRSQLSAMSKKAKEGAAEDKKAVLIADTLIPLIEDNKLRIPRGGYLLRRGRGRVIVERPEEA